jgi:hypothetical protein
MFFRYIYGFECNALLKPEKQNFFLKTVDHIWLFLSIMEISKTIKIRPILNWQNQTFLLDFWVLSTLMILFKALTEVELLFLCNEFSAECIKL